MKGEGEGEGRREKERLYQAKRQVLPFHALVPPALIATRDTRDLRSSV
jgi:hypothetical protein